MEDNDFSEFLEYDFDEIIDDLSECAGLEILKTFDPHNEGMIGCVNFRFFFVLASKLDHYGSLILVEKETFNQIYDLRTEDGKINGIIFWNSSTFIVSFSSKKRQVSESFCVCYEICPLKDEKIKPLKRFSISTHSNSEDKIKLLKLDEGSFICQVGNERMVVFSSYDKNKVVKKWRETFLSMDFLEGYDPFARSYVHKNCFYLNYFNGRYPVKIINYKSYNVVRSYKMYRSSAINRDCICAIETFVKGKIEYLVCGGMRTITIFNTNIRDNGSRVCEFDIPHSTCCLRSFGSKYLSVGDIGGNFVLYDLERDNLLKKMRIKNKRIIKPKTERLIHGDFSGFVNQIVKN